MQCTRKEIAGFFECSEDTICRDVQREHGVTFEVYRDEKAEAGRISLRRKQMQVAMGGNVTMLIWLGKQYLGQTDKSNVDVGSDEGRVLRITYSNGAEEHAKAEDGN